MRRLRLLLALGALAAVAAAILLAGDPVIAWASARQRLIQNDLAEALLAVRRGDGAAMAAMIGVCASYGVIHAIGPGHGKMVISGAAFASRRTARRMAALGLLSSLAQGLTAIALVYGGLGLFALASRSLIRFSETWLTAASYGAIALVGLWLLWRGGRLVLRLTRAASETAPGAARDAGVSGQHSAADGHGDHDPHRHTDACAAGCRHLPDADAVERVGSWREALALVLSIGLRPCSGALVVLALSWRYELYLVGALSAVTMALGTGAVVAAIALMAVRLRDAGPLREPGAVGLWSLATAQLAIGAAIMIVSLALAASALQQESRSHPLAALPAGPAASQGAHAA